MRDKRESRNCGFTFIEILCAIAILSLISGTIATIVTVSTRTYRKGISETSVQQEAQLAANNIGDIIKDACKIVYYDKSGAVYENGVLNSEATSSVTNTLSIVTNDNKQYDVQYDSTAKRLVYSEGTVGGEIGTPQLLAGNISEFTVDTTGFKDNRTVSLDLTVEDETTGRNIPMSYTMTSRNDIIDNLDYNVVSEAVKIYALEEFVCLVPGQSYRIPIMVTGGYDKKLYYSGDIKSDANPNGIIVSSNGYDYDYVDVQIPINESKVEYNDVYTVTVSTENDVSGNVIATRDIKVYCRYADTVKVTYSADTSKAEGGTKEGKGAKYTFYANVSGANLTKFAARSWDSDYKNGHAVYWSFELTNDGKTYKYSYSTALDGDGKIVESNSYSPSQGEVNKILKVESSYEDIDRPSITVALTDTMSDDFELVVTAVSKHAQGINKASSKYDLKDVVKGSATLKPRGTKITKTYDITLAPNELGKVDLSKDMVGAVATDKSVTFEYVDSTDADSKATYKSGVVSITPGTNEFGVGKSGSGDLTPYTFRVKVLVNKVEKTIIKVHVRRVEEIHIVKEAAKWADEDGNVASTPTQDFKVRFNTTKSGQDDTPITYLINGDKAIDYSTDKSEEYNAIYNALAVEITWGIKSKSMSNDLDTNTMVKDSVRLYAAVEYVTVKDGWSADKKDEAGTFEVTKTIEGKVEVLSSSGSNNSYYTNEHIKPAKVRIYLKADGTEIMRSLKQPPEIDLKMKYSTGTGLPAGTKLIMTATALHPSAAYNKGNKNYYTTSKITDTYVLEGANSATIDLIGIDAETEEIDVEPGQTIKIPFYIEAGYLWSFGSYIDNRWSTDTVIDVISFEAEKGTLDVTPKDREYWMEYERDESTAEYSDEIVTCYITVKIGKGERGNNGIFTLTLKGWGDTGNQTQREKDIVITLRVRKVENVTLSVANNGDINALNKSESEITLEAKPTGFGNNGVEYYRKHDAWWDTGKYEYKSPYDMKWYFIESNGTVHDFRWLQDEMHLITIDTPTETDGYTISGDYMYPTDADSSSAGHKAVLSFKINKDKQLPAGTIRVVSQHSLGANKKNKTEQNYSSFVNGVHDDLTINADDADTPTLVRNEYTSLSGYFEAVNTRKMFYRYRTKTTDGTSAWSQYYILSCYSPENGYIEKNELNIFDCNSAYEIEVVSVRYDENSKTILYPLNNDLLVAGSGWKENGYHLGTGDETPIEKQTFNMNKVSFRSYSYYGSTPVDEPLEEIIYQGGYKEVIFKLDGINTDNWDWNSNQNWVKMYSIQKKGESGWNDSDIIQVNSNIYQNLELKRGWNVIYLKFNNSDENLTAGEYRIKLSIDPGALKTINNSNMFNWTTTDAERVILDDYIYITVE